MNKEIVLKEFLERAVNDNVLSYIDMLESLPRNEAKDPYWKNLLDLYDSSNELDKGILVQFIKHVSEDSVALMLSIIDALVLSDEKENELQGSLLETYIGLCESSTKNMRKEVLDTACFDIEMNNGDLVQAFISRCVDGNVSFFKQLLENSPRDEDTSVKIIDFYDRLNIKNKQFITTLIRQVSIDSVATVLSIIDGYGYSELSEGLVLSDKFGNDLQGYLSDILLETCE